MMQMSIRRVFLIAFILSPSQYLVSGLYFHIGERERKCFIEENPDDTMVTGIYKIQLYDPKRNDFAQNRPEIGMHVEVKDPDAKIILSKVYSSEGRFTFTSAKPGEHVICLYTNSTKWFSGSQLRVHLDIKIAEHDYAKLAEKEKLTLLQLRVRQLLNQVELIKKEQNYQREHEMRFRQTSESTNQRVLWWALTQTIILLCMGAWQIKHIKGFFQAKKIV